MSKINCWPFWSVRLGIVKIEPKYIIYVFTNWNTSPYTPYMHTPPSAKHTPYTLIFNHNHHIQHKYMILLCNLYATECCFSRSRQTSCLSCCVFQLDYFKVMERAHIVSFVFTSVIRNSYWNHSPLTFTHPHTFTTPQTCPTFKPHCLLTQRLRLADCCYIATQCWFTRFRRTNCHDPVNISLTISSYIVES